MSTLSLKARWDDAANGGTQQALVTQCLKQKSKACSTEERKIAEDFQRRTKGGNNTGGVLLMLSAAYMMVLPRRQTRQP